MTSHPFLPPLNHSNQTVLVSGAAGMLGYGIAQTYAQAGANVVVHAKSLTQANVAVERLLTDSQAGDLARDQTTTHLATHSTGSQQGDVARDQTTTHSATHSTGFQITSDQLLGVAGDITNPQDCEQMISQIIKRFRTLDVLVNNAGVQPVQPLNEMTKTSFEDVVSTNLTGTFVLTKAALKPMVAAKRGVVTCIASIEATTPARNHAHYNASKAGVAMFARNVALEYGQFGIRSNSVSPGLIDDGDLAIRWPEGFASWNRQVPLERCATPQDIAHACLFLSSPYATFISGHDLVVDGGMDTVPAW